MRARIPLLAGLAAIAAGCGGNSYTGQAVGVVPKQSPSDALACLIKAAEAKGYKQERADSGAGDGSAVMRKVESQKEARSGDPNEFYQGDELKLETAPGSSGTVKATVTPFFIVVTRTAAGPNTTLYPPKSGAIADAPVVLSACGTPSAAGAK
jgi:hypothetical protein